MAIIDILKENADASYKDFQAKLVPNIDESTILGLRVPVLRNIAKSLNDEEEVDIFLSTLPHKYYDEYMLESILISNIKDYDKCISFIDKFLLYIDNWAVCDILSPKIFKKNKDRLIVKIKEWINSNHIYTSRFGIEMLMTFYLDEDFKAEYLSLVSNVKTDEYYLQMMVAWFFATALAKQWDATIPVLENNMLSGWIHNKTISKARESFRITNEQKEYLNTLKRKKV